LEIALRRRTPIKAIVWEGRKDTFRTVQGQQKIEMLSNSIINTKTLDSVVAYVNFLLTRNRKSRCLSNLKLNMSFLLQGMETLSSHSEETPLNLRLSKEQAGSFPFWSLVRQLEDPDRHVSDNKEEPRQTEDERHQKACKVINLANETRQASLDTVMTEANEIKSKMTPLPNSPQQIERRRREDLKRNEARQGRRSEAQRIGQMPVRPRMSMEFAKLPFFGDLMQRISRCKRCGAILHVAGESCLWKPAVDSVEVEEDDDDKEATLWCHPDSPFAALHKAKEATTVHQCLFSQCPDRGEHLTVVCPTLQARCVRCSLRGHQEVTEIIAAEGTLVPACPDSKNNSLQDSIVAFEKAADLGILTQF
jgi:hypothetical protein